MRNRGKLEKRLLTEEEKEARENLPEGIGIEYSPLWDFPEFPLKLLNPLLRYFFVADQLMWHLEKDFSAPKRLNILDVGCGYGEMRSMIGEIRLAAGYQRRYIGVDGDPMKLERARKIFPKMDFREMILPEGLTQIEQTFEGFICQEVIEHMKLLEGKRLLHLMYELAVPGAVAVFTVPTPEYGKRRYNPLHPHEYPVREFLEVVQETRWEMCDWFWLRVGHKSLPPRPTRVPGALYQALVAPQIRDPDAKGTAALYVLKKGKQCQ